MRGTAIWSRFALGAAVCCRERPKKLILAARVKGTHAMYGDGSLESATGTTPFSINHLRRLFKDLPRNQPMFSDNVLANEGVNDAVRS